MPTATITAPSTATYTTSSGRTIHTGDPGETWVNTTERVQYQLIVAFINSCGICIQYANQIGSPWPIPFHFGCRCSQRAIRVGAAAPNPFVDYRQVIDDLPPDQRAKVVGVSSLKLIDSGVVNWQDVVTGSRIRDLREVVDRHSLSVKTLVDAGVKPSIATAAHSAVHTTEHEHAARQRRELMEKLIGAGVHSDKLINALAKGLASRVSIAAGEGSTLKSGEKLGPAWGGSRVLPPTAGDELARALLGMKLAGGKVVVPKAEPKPAAVTVPAEPVKPAVPRPFEPAVDGAAAVRPTGPGEELPAKPIAPAKEKAKALRERKEAAAPAEPAALATPTETYTKNRTELAKVHGQIIGVLATSLNMSPEIYKAKLLGKLSDVVEEGDFYLRTTVDVLPKLLETGRFKSQFETATSRGSYNPAKRKMVEDKVIGVDKNEKKQDRPIYGYLSTKDFTSFGDASERAVGQYGHVAVKLKPEVRQRATVTVGDSFGHENVAATPATAITLESLPMGTERRWPAAASAQHFMGFHQELLIDTTEEATRRLGRRYNYIEAQYHGQLHVSDIAEIAFEGQPSAAIKSDLEARGIKWRVIENP